MFKIHPQLLNDCHLLGTLDHHHVLLHKNALLHWFILVPETNCTNLLALKTVFLNRVMQSAQSLNQYLMDDLNYNKTNVASIGNIVDQCHVHIVGRATDDACWPQPVWGNLAEGHEYNADAINSIKADLKQKFALLPAL